MTSSRNKGTINGFVSFVFSVLWSLKDCHIILNTASLGYRFDHFIPPIIKIKVITLIIRDGHCRILLRKPSIFVDT